MFFTYLDHNEVGKYRQNGNLNSKMAIFLNAYLAASIIFNASESCIKLESRQPNLTSKDTLPMPEKKTNKKKEIDFIFLFITFQGPLVNFIIKIRRHLLIFISNLYHPIIYTVNINIVSNKYPYKPR